MLTPEYLARIRAQAALTPEQARIRAGMSPRAPVQGSVLGASTSRGDAPFTDDMMGVPFRNENVARAAGVYGQEAANRQIQQDYNNLGFSGSSQNYERGVNVFTAASIAKQYGLQGVNEKMFVGLSPFQARKKAAELQSARKGQTSALTSSVFNSDTTSGFKKNLSNMQLKVDSVSNDPWVWPGEKKSKQSAIVNSFTDQIAGLFGSQDELEQAMNNPEFQKSLNIFQQLGGDINAVASRITKTPTVGIMGESQNADGSFSVDKSQDMNSYLGAMKNTTDQQALDSIIPQKLIYQDQIAYEQSIPDKFRNEYFGTPEKIGIVQQRRQQKEEEVKLIETRAKADEKNMRAQASFAIEKNQMQLAIEADIVEENRLNAKNYMTGMLAKLGALNTTGAAPQAIATLEQKYQAQAQKLRTSYEMNNREIELKLNENVDDINNSMNENILKTKQDLSKSEEDIWKEIFKLQTDADRKSLSTVEKYSLQFKSQREKFAKEAKIEAEKNAKAYQKLAQKYDANKLAQTISDRDMEGGYVVRGKQKGILKPDGRIEPFTLTPDMAQQVKNAQVFGQDAIRFFTSVNEQAFRDYLVTNDKFRLNKQQLQSEYKAWQEAKKKKGKDDDLLAEFNILPKKKGKDDDLLAGFNITN